MAVGHIERIEGQIDILDKEVQSKISVCNKYFRTALREVDFFGLKVVSKYFILTQDGTLDGGSESSVFEKI